LIKNILIKVTAFSQNRISNLFHRYVGGVLFRVDCIDFMNSFRNLFTMHDYIGDKLLVPFNMNNRSWVSDGNHIINRDICKGMMLKPIFEEKFLFLDLYDGVSIASLGVPVIMNKLMKNGIECDRASVMFTFNNKYCIWGKNKCIYLKGISACCSEVNIVQNGVLMREMLQLSVNLFLS